MDVSDTAAVSASCGAFPGFAGVVRLEERLIAAFLALVRGGF